MPFNDSQTYAVCVHPGDLRFSAAHFITLNGTCEHLHGHNFHVRIDVTGDNNADAFVVDFVELNRVTAHICDGLHDRILLAGDSREMSIERADGMLHVRGCGKRFAFPEDNCAVLPLTNTTAEMLAHHIGVRLHEELPAEALERARLLEVAVEEADQQWGISRWELTHG